MPSARAVKARTLAPLPLARSIAESILILSWSGCAKLMVGHPDMPTFRFTREDARAFLLYLRSIQAP